jgi:hypothetical protein
MREAGVVIRRFKMPRIVMFHKPNMSPDITVMGLKVLQVPQNWAFKVEVDFDSRIFSAIEKDHLLLKEMNQAAQKAYKQTCDAIKSKYSSFDGLIANMINKGEKKPVIEANLQGLNKALENDRRVGEAGAQEAIKAEWTRYSLKKSEYRNYRIGIIATIIGAGGSLITSITLMATTPFTGGASAAFGIIGMFKSATTFVKEIGSAWIEVETSHKILETQLNVVEAEAKRAKGLAIGNEYAAAVVNQFLGVAQPSIKACDSQLSTIRKKLSGIEIKTHEASKTLNGILDSQQKFRAEFMREVQAKLSKNPSKDAPGQVKLIEARLDRLLATSYTAVQESIQKVETLFDRFKKAEALTDQLEARMQPLRLLRGLDNKIIENVLYFVDLPLGALNGNAIATETGDLVNGLVPPATFMAYEKITSVVLEGTLLV